MYGQTPKLLTPALTPTPGQSVDSDSGSDSSGQKKVDFDSKMESAPGLTATPESESPIFDPDMSVPKFRVCEACNKNSATPPQRQNSLMQYHFALI